MKKILFITTLAALLPLLFSCGKQENGSENQFEEPRFVQYAGKLVPRSGTPAAASLAVTTYAVVTPTIAYLEFTESGLFVIGRTTGDDIEYATGTYTTADGKVFSLSNNMTVTLSSNAAGLVDVSISPSGESFKADLTKANGTNVAYRSWTIDKIRATVKGHGTPVTAEFNGCNFSEIRDFLNKNGHKGDYLPSGSLTSISFTGTNSVMFAFSDNTADRGECTINGSNVSFSFMSKSRLFELKDGTATIDYLDGKCILKVDGNLDNSTTSGSVTFVMSPMK